MLKSTRLTLMQDAGEWSPKYRFKKKNTPQISMFIDWGMIWCNSIIIKNVSLIPICSACCYYFLLRLLFIAKTAENFLFTNISLQTYHPLLLGLPAPGSKKNLADILKFIFNLKCEIWGNCQYFVFEITWVHVLSIFHIDFVISSNKNSFNYVNEQQM